MRNVDRIPCASTSPQVSNLYSRFLHFSSFPVMHLLKYYNFVLVVPEFQFEKLATSVPSGGTGLRGVARASSSLSLSSCEGVRG